MRAVICDRYEGMDALRVDDTSDPASTPGMALVEVEAAGVNFADTLMVAGQYQFKPDPPFVPGSEFAGTIISAEGLDGLDPGDRVCGFVSHGAMAEQVLAHPASLMRLPDGVSFEVGTALPVAYGTSYHALVDRGRLAEGETLLVLGAAGGVGLAAVQIGKVLGARVIAAVSSEAKAEVVLAAGADEVIRYDQVPLREGIATASAGRGVDVVYDPVGGAATELALRSTNWNGRLLVVGFASGDIPSIPLNLTLVKGNALVGVFWGRFTTEEPERSAHNNQVIMEWLEDGKISPQVQKTYPLDQAAEAFHWVAGRKAIGRVVILP